MVSMFFWAAQRLLDQLTACESPRTRSGGDGRSFIEGREIEVRFLDNAD
jgi:hypothetical protein